MYSVNMNQKGFAAAMRPMRLKLPDLSMTFRLNRVIPFLDRPFLPFFQEVDRLLTKKEK